VMMHARAQAAIMFAEGKRAEARSVVEGALSTIREFFCTRGGTEAFEAANEVIALRAMQKDMEQRS